MFVVKTLPCTIEYYVGTGQGPATLKWITPGKKKTSHMIKRTGSGSHIHNCRRYSCLRQKNINIGIDREPAYNELLLPLVLNVGDIA